MESGQVIYIVIVNYGRAQDTIECLQSLYVLENVQYRVILIDNGSPDDSVSKLNQWLDLDGGAELWQRSPLVGGKSYDVKFVQQHNNIGFAGGCNLGLNEAQNDPRCSHVWLLNNDTLVEPQSLHALISRFHEAPKLGICGSTLVYYKPVDTLQGCGGRFSLLLGRGTAIGQGRTRHNLPDQLHVEQNMSYVIGASMLVSMSLVRTIGPMDARYFLYFEELDWALRARRAHFQLGWAPDSIVIHKEGAAIGTSTRGKSSELATFFMTSSYLRLLCAHKPLLLPLALALSFARSIRLMFRLDFKSGKAVLDGIASFMTNPWRYGLGSYRDIGSPTSSIIEGE